MTRTRRDTTAPEALERLRAGNARYAGNLRSVDSMLSHNRRDDLLVEQQAPVAIVLGCSDSRAPAETVFDQGLGDLFVIRVAGNIVAPSQIGSVEFAAEVFGTRLVVVMGHTGCGAVTATVQAVLDSAAPGSRNRQSIIDRIRPTVEPLCHTELARDRAALVRASVRANVLASVNQLSHGSEVLESMMRSDGLCVIGAEYDLSTGQVQFLDECI
jgi:carbonic anhydrase